MVWPSRAGHDPFEGDEVEEAGAEAGEIERWRRVRVDESDAYECRDSTDHTSAAASLATRGIALRQQGRLGEAMSLYDRALDLFQATAQAEDTAQAQAQAQAEAAEAEAAARSPFQFGSAYTHFFYTLAPTPPHQLLATSAEFCVGAAQAPHDCESVQFIAGLALEASARAALQPGQPEPRRGRSNGSRLVLSFGVNDCEAKLGLVPMQRVWKLLQPLPPAEAPCTVH